MFILQPQALVVEAFLGEVLDLQQPLHDLEHGAIEERQGQVTERGVGKALLERAAGRGAR